MKNTQAKKLSKILEIGSLVRLEDDRFLNYINSHYSAEYCEKLKKEKIIHESKGEFLYLFAPYESKEFSFDSVLQWTKNPFTLINIIFHCEF
jgi:hypothetical protein